MGDLPTGLSEREGGMDQLVEHHWSLAQGIGFQEEAPPLPADQDSTLRLASDCWLLRIHGWRIEASRRELMNECWVQARSATEEL